MRRRFGRQGVDLDEFKGAHVEDGCLAVFEDGFALALLVVVVLGLFVTVVFPVLAVAAEVTYLVLLLFGGIVGRFVFRRPWTIEAVADDGSVFEWPVVGWRPSGAARAHVAEQLRAGRVPRDTEVQRAARRRG